MIEVSERTTSGYWAASALGDHPAHRDADDVHGSQLERADQPGGISAMSVSR
jgi:hypothetical protein